MGTVFALAMLGAVAIMLLPRHEEEEPSMAMAEAQRAAPKLP